MSKKPGKIISSPTAFIGVNGNGIISFGSGQPDLPPPKEIFKDLGRQRLFKYSLVQGDKKLREALAGEYPRAKAEDFVITNGASEALDLVFRAIHEMHGPVKVLVCRPYYYSYPPVIELAGLRIVYTDLKEGRIDLDDFKKKVRGVKAVLINSPSNPTGRVEALDTLREIEKITARLGVYVISDEVYKDLIYEREHARTGNGSASDEGAAQASLKPGGYLERAQRFYLQRTNGDGLSSLEAGGCILCVAENEEFRSRCIRAFSRPRRHRLRRRVVRRAGPHTPFVCA